MKDLILLLNKKMQATVGVKCFNCDKQAFGRQSVTLFPNNVATKWLCFEHYKEFLGDRFK